MAKLNAKNVIWLWPSTKKITEAKGTDIQNGNQN